MKITDPPLNSKRYPSSCQENYSLLTGPYTHIVRENFWLFFSKWPFPGLFFISDNLQNINGRLYRDSNSDCQSIRHTRLPSDLHYSQKSSFTVNYLNGTLCVWASPLKFKKCFWFKSVRANGRMSEWVHNLGKNIQGFFALLFWPLARSTKLVIFFIVLKVKNFYLI